MKTLRGLKLTRLHWTIMRSDIRKFFSEEMRSDIKYCKIPYDKESGLSKGIVFVGLGDANITDQLIRKGKLEGGSLSCEIYGTEWMDTSAERKEK